MEFGTHAAVDRSNPSRRLARSTPRTHEVDHSTASNMAHALIGTSGWHYASWRGPFFPPELRIKDQLRYYATQFSTAELNGVFYRTPTEDAVRGWRDHTPDDFVFSWKASKFITHWKRLSVRSENSLALLESRLSILGNKADPILFQLPPQFARND